MDANSPLAHADSLDTPRYTQSELKRHGHPAASYAKLPNKPKPMLIPLAFGRQGLTVDLPGQFDYQVWSAARRCRSPTRWRPYSLQDFCPLRMDSGLPAGIHQRSRWSSPLRATFCSAFSAYNRASIPSHQEGSQWVMMT